MERKYTYENGTIYISGLSKKNVENLKRSTEEFLKKVIKENQNGNGNKSRDI